MRRTLLTGLLVLIGCGPRVAQLTFQARVSDLRHAPKDKRADDFVEITAPGELLDPPGDVKQVARKDADWRTPEDATASIVSANIAGDASWAADNYVAEEREQARRGLRDPAVAQRTWDYYRNMGKVVTMGWAEVRGFRLIFLSGRDEDGDTTFVVLTLKRTADGWRESNALANSEEFEVIWTALNTGGIRAA